MTATVETPCHIRPIHHRKRVCLTVGYAWVGGGGLVRSFCAVQCRCATGGLFICRASPARPHLPRFTLLPRVVFTKVRAVTVGFPSHFPPPLYVEYRLSCEPFTEGCEHCNIPPRQHAPSAPHRHLTSPPHLTHMRLVHAAGRLGGHLCVQLCFRRAWAGVVSAGKFDDQPLHYTTPFRLTHHLPHAIHSPHRLWGVPCFRRDG